MIDGETEASGRLAPTLVWPVLAIAVTGFGGALLVEQPAALAAAVDAAAGIPAPLLGATLLLAVLIGYLVRFVVEGRSHTAALEAANRELAATQTALQQARDAALESVRLKTQFLANMSHEIRTPLNGIIGMTDLMLGTELQPDQQEQAELVRGSADALLTIVNDILDLSKMEAGMLRIENIDFAPRNVIDGTTELFAEIARRKGVDLTTLVRSDVPDELRGDPGRVRQVLTNLVGNAIKFTAAGDVTVRVRTDGKTDDRTTITFEVSDTGIGIEPEVQPNLFHPFVQGDGSTARRFGGTGLGLAISKQLVERMGGSIGFESRPGAGSTFWFSVPFESRSQGDTGKSARMANLDGLRLLIVDDSAANRSVLSHYGADWNMETAETNRGTSALQWLRKAAQEGRDFDIVITDLLLPDMTGFELARVIRTDPALARAHVILMPSFGKRGHAQDAREAGVSAYLVKPVKEKELLECLIAVVTDQEPADAPPRLVTRHSIAETSPQRQQRLLIAEDNLVNQKLLVAQVGQLGLRSDIVENGAEALEAVERNEYAVVLMDCQMPVLDGYEATRELRRREAGRHHTPVIAVTANALEGDRERCIDAGMDDYLAKPVRRDELRAVLGRWLPGVEPTDASDTRHADTSVIARAAHVHPVRQDTDTRSEQAGDASAVFRDRLEELHEECGTEVLACLVEIFLEDTADGIREMRESIAQNDGETLEQKAHTLKGSARNIGADKLAAVFETVEDRAGKGDFDGMDERIEEAVIRLEGARRLLESWTRQPGAA